MREIADQIAQAVGKPVRYVAVTPAERRESLLASGATPYFADALVEQAAERLRAPCSGICLRTHEALGIEPTPFLAFARRNAAAFLGEASAS